MYVPSDNEHFQFVYFGSLSNMSFSSLFFSNVLKTLYTEGCVWMMNDMAKQQSFHCRHHLPPLPSLFSLPLLSPLPRVARKSSHQFPSEMEAEKWLIYNYNPVYSGKLGSGFEQVYLISE